VSPAESAEGVESLDSAEGPESADPAEPVDPAESMEDLEPVESAGPAERVEPADPAGLLGGDPIVALTQQRDDYRDALIRLQADFENYKKRMIKQQTDHLERAATALVDKLLPVLDTADLAIAHGGGEDVKQITSALTSVLEREGLERIDPDGGPFDPTLHDAVAHEPSDDGQQEVVEVMRAGYRWKGRVLRPAMVKVRG
jgi:molecular chaperone GrpE